MNATARPLPVSVVERARAGDRAAQRALVEQLGPLVLALCRRSAADPEDAFQGAWERVFKALPGFDPNGPAKLSTWVATLTHRHLVDLARRGRTRARVIDLPRPHRRELEEAVVHQDEVKRLDDAVVALPEALRRVVVAHYLGEVPLPELAVQEGVPVGTLKSRLHRARGLLARAMGER